jgi:hypothetical protein
LKGSQGAVKKAAAFVVKFIVSDLALPRSPRETGCQSSCSAAELTNKKNDSGEVGLLKKSVGRIAYPTNVSLFSTYVARAISPRWRFEEKRDIFDSLTVPHYSASE